MTKNVGKTDKIIRITLGIVLISLFWIAPAPLKWLSILGVILVATGALNFCGLYTLLGINTCRTNQ